jgi:Na+-driven multidrug efflux pump
MAKPIARLFSAEEEVIEYIVLYLSIVPLGYAFRSVSDIVVNVLNVLRKPLLSASLVFGQMIVLIIPLVYLGAQIWEVKGVFIGLIIANICIGIIAFLTIKFQLQISFKGKNQQSTQQ